MATRPTCSAPSATDGTQGSNAGKGRRNRSCGAASKPRRSDLSEYRWPSGAEEPLRLAQLLLRRPRELHRPRAMVSDT